MSRACRHCRSPARGNPCWSRRFGAHEKECAREDREAREARLQQAARDAIEAQARYLRQYETEQHAAFVAHLNRLRPGRRWWLYREIFYYITAFALMGWTIWIIAVTHP